jgi:hypothetical protein
MSRYTFTCEHFEYDNFTGDKVGVASKTTTEFQTVDLSTMLENFESFLRASGFHFDGQLEIVHPDDYCVDIESTEDEKVNSSVWNQIISNHLRFMETKNLEGNCEICKLPKSVMATHNCFEKNCPVHNAN